MSERDLISLWWSMVYLYEKTSSESSKGFRTIDNRQSPVMVIFYQVETNWLLTPHICYWHQHPISVDRNIIERSKKEKKHTHLHLLTLQLCVFCHLVCLSFSPASVSPPIQPSLFCFLGQWQSSGYVLYSCYQCLFAGQAKRPQRRNERSCCSLSVKNKSSQSPPLRLYGKYILNPADTVKSDGRSATPSVTAISKMLLSLF